MSAEISISEEVQDLLSSIIAKNKFSDKSAVTYSAGSDTGDGYMSKTYAVNIQDGNQSLDLFVKCGLNLIPTDMLPIDKYYANEMHFYDNLYPTYREFLREKNVQDGFRHVAKCYGTSSKHILVLENLKKKGYAMCNKRESLNEQHVELVFRTFAKFHALSFAFKDQKTEEYEQLITPTQNVFDNFGNNSMEESTKAKINEFWGSLDPLRDRHILDTTANLGEMMCEAANAAFRNENEPEYSILTQGDCWCNNILFLYEDNDKENPVDIMLVDWQIIRTCLPVNDLAYFFYTIASEEIMKNYKHYLQVYHEELSKQMKQLGSDPDVLYPFSVLERHWKLYGKFGFYMAFILIRIMLSKKDETLNLENIDLENPSSDGLFIDIKESDEYFRRLKIILEHMVNNGML